MKKILSMFLILSMCMGLFISCDNGDVTSSSEVQSQSESVSESQSESQVESESSSAQNPPASDKELIELGNFGSPMRYMIKNHNNSELPIYDEYNQGRYYKMLAGVSDNLNGPTISLDAPKSPIFTDYDTLSRFFDEIQLEKPDASLFESNYVIYAEIDLTEWGAKSMGYHGLTYDNGTLSVYFDIISCGRGVDGTFDPHSIFNAYIIVPKEHFGECDVASYTEAIDVNLLVYRDGNSSTSSKEFGKLGCPIDCIDRIATQNEIPIYDDYNVEHEYRTIIDTFSDPRLVKPEKSIFKSYEELSTVLTAEQLKGYGTSIFRDSYAVYVETTIPSWSLSKSYFHRLVFDGDCIYICLDLIADDLAINEDTTEARYGAYIIIPIEDFDERDTESFSGCINTDIFVLRSNQ